MSKKRYLNCKYLDAGMDGMLCSLGGLCTTCTEFHGKKCHCYTPKDETKEKQIEEMGKVLCNDLGCKYCEKCFHLRKAENIYNAGYRKVPEDSVVLTIAEVDEFRKDSAEVKFLKKRIQDEARKETAREIIGLVKTFSPNKELGVIIAKRYGVEIEE